MPPKIFSRETLTESLPQSNQRKKVYKHSPRQRKLSKQTIKSAVHCRETVEIVLLSRVLISATKTKKAKKKTSSLQGKTIRPIQFLQRPRVSVLTTGAANCLQLKTTQRAT